MTLLVPSTEAGDDAPAPEERPLAARVGAGPGAWEDEEWLSDLRREPLPESLMADGAIAAAAAADHGHELERALNAEVTALSLVCGELFPALGSGSTMALVFGLRASRSGPVRRYQPTQPTPRSGRNPGRLLGYGNGRQIPKVIARGLVAFAALSQHESQP